MAERQTHGKLYEHILFERNPDWIDMRDDHIAKDDFYLDDGTPISAKCQQVGKSVYFADVHRMYQKEKDFLIYNAWYEGRPPKTIEWVKKALCEENIIKVDIQKWKKLWGNYEAIKDKLDDLKNFDSEENKINPKRKAEYKAYCAEVKKLYCNHNAIIKITPKISNKLKKRGPRWQCYIDNSTFRRTFLMKKESNPTSKFLNKDDLDRFYTKPSVVDDLLNEITLEGYDVVVEPSAGTGSWSSKIDDCVAIDIAPEHPDIMKGDFLEDDFLFDEMKKENRILVIGNPPFGRIGNKAIKFINKAAEFADTVAFILPRSFRKESLQRKINKNFWLVKDIDLFEESCFIFKGEDYFAPCVFQVWQRRIEERDTTKKKIDPVGFSYVKREDANLVVRRVGGAAGTAYMDKIEERSIPPNYFLWVDDPQEVAKAIDEHDFDVHDTVGPESLTKGELTIFINSLTKP